MKSTTVWGLIILNVVLLAAFVWRLVPENSAIAQRAGGVAPRGDYLVIPTEVNGLSSGILVVLDQTNGQLSAVVYDESNNNVEMMPKVDLRQVFGGPAQVAPQRGARRGN